MNQSAMMDASKLGADWKVELIGNDLYLKHAECNLTIRDVDCQMNSNKTNGYGISGTTNFLYDGTEYTFDRLGIEQSFYFGGEWDSFKSLSEAAQAQVLRVLNRKKQLQEQGGLVTVPGTRIQITRSKQQELTKQLSSKGRISVYPSGFGTGYTFSKKRTSNWCKPASMELAIFFGSTTKLWMDTIDCD